MKDLPHHIKKLNRNVLRSFHREELEEAMENVQLPKQKETSKELQKIAKRKMRKDTESKIPVYLSDDERNRKMKHRVPIFDRNNALPRTAKPTRKKTPKL